MAPAPSPWPAAQAELEAVFAVYEAALVANDLDTLDALFLASPQTVRYGIGENLYGIEAIRAFRAARPAAGLARTLRRTQISAHGPDCGTAMTEFIRPAFLREGRLQRIGRQSQTWIRTAQPGHGGWRVVAAHVSLIDLDPPQPLAAPGPPEA